MVVMNFCALGAGDRPKMQIWTVLHLHEDRDAGTQRGQGELLPQCDKTKMVHQ